MLTRAILTVFLISTNVQAEMYYDPDCQTYKSPWSKLCAETLTDAIKMMGIDKRLTNAKGEDLALRDQVVLEAAGLD